ncbi:hypothetical protein PENTCL1PPCAC_8228, partial [Pristionchus entomophagus]
GMVALKPPGCPATGGAPVSPGSLCSRPCMKYLALAAAGGVLAYLIYSYAAASSGSATAGCEVAKSNSGQKKKGARTRGKKRRSASSARLGKTSSSSASTPGKPEEIAESPATPTTKAEIPTVILLRVAPPTPASSTATAPVDQTEPTQ